MLTFDLSIIDLLLGPKVDLLLAKQHPSSHLRISLHFVLQYHSVVANGKQIWIEHPEMELSITLSSAYIVFGYMVFSAIWSIFSWNNRMVNFMGNSSLIWCKTDGINAHILTFLAISASKYLQRGAGSIMGPLRASHFLWIMTGLAVALSICSFSFAGEILADNATGGRQDTMINIRAKKCRNHISA